MNYEKLSPELAALVDTYERGGAAALAGDEDAFGLVSLEDGPKPARIVVFVHTENNASLADLEAAGVEINQADGAIRTGIVPLDSIDALSEHPAVKLIEPAQKLEFFMDVAAPRVGVPTFRDTTGLTGAGVLIGVVDTGIEYTHPSFAGRILRTWDQTIPGPGVPEGGYGAELTGDLLRISRDTSGHGTHVAGIAASADPVFTGVAPRAELIIVKTDLVNAHVVDAVRYVFRVAGELGRPAVVNLSLGGNADPHDGTDAMSKIVDEQTGPGRIVCCAAGNSGTDDLHAQVMVREGTTHKIFLALPKPMPGRTGRPVTLSGWYSGDDELEVALATPAGMRTPFQGVITDGSPVRVYDLPDATVRITTPGPNPANGDHNFVMQIQPLPPPPMPALPWAWRLSLRAGSVTNGRVDIWSTNPSAAVFRGKAVKDSTKVGAPGAATRAVTVASFTTRTEWDDIFGNHHDAGLEVDDISDFSSEGPRRDGVEKPDVAGPGAMIVSAMSVHSPAIPALLIDDLHTIMAGTSMACPFIAGVVALLLEREPDLDPELVKERFRAHSAIPDQPPGTFDNQWGFGLLDVAALAGEPDGAQEIDISTEVAST